MANYYGYPCIWNFNFNDTAMRDYANTNIWSLASLGDQLYYARTGLSWLTYRNNNLRSYNELS